IVCCATHDSLPAASARSHTTSGSAIFRTSTAPFASVTRLRRLTPGTAQSSEADPHRRETTRWSPRQGCVLIADRGSRPLALRPAPPAAPQSPEDRHQHRHGKERNGGRDEELLRLKTEPEQYAAQERPNNGADSPKPRAQPAPVERICEA